jgi:hypothetical protein
MADPAARFRSEATARQAARWPAVPWSVRRAASDLGRDTGQRVTYFSKVRTHWHRSLVALLLIFSIGGHWVILQSFAWASMFVSYVQTESVSVALTKTFRGEKCHVCHLVDEGKKAEKKQEIQKPKLDLLLDRNIVDVAIDLDHRVVLGRRPPPESRWDTPPLPPPRWA